MPLHGLSEHHQGGARGGREDGRPMSEADNKWIGRSVARLEDPPLVLGQASYAGDISFPRQLHMRVVRSNVAHGQIVAIDTAPARAAPGVVAVWTASDIADRPPIDF